MTVAPSPRPEELVDLLQTLGLAPPDADRRTANLAAEDGSWLAALLRAGVIDEAAVRSLGAVSGQTTRQLAPRQRTLLAQLQDEASRGATLGAGASRAAAAASSHELQPGQRLGDYEVLALLGAGGMGAVYRARSLMLDRVLALKVILTGAAAGPAEVERFRREARAAARLHHPGIVAIHEVGDDDGRSYYTMDLVDGDSLADRLARGPLPVEDALALMAQLADAVAYAHLNGVLHRDLKPANVLVDRAGRPRIADFGLAKRTDVEHTRLTASGVPLGTPAYMPPEQAAGRIDEIDERADVYSLGAILYEMLTGQPPHTGETLLAVLHQVVSADIVPPGQLRPGLDREVEAICLKTLARQPAQRYASARALADDIGRHVDGLETLARPLTLAGRLWRGLARNRVTVAVVGLLLLGGAFHVVRLQRALGLARRAESAAAAAAVKARRAEAGERARSLELKGQYEELQRVHAELRRHQRRRDALERARLAAAEVDPQKAAAGFAEALGMSDAPFEVLRMQAGWLLARQRYGDALRVLRLAEAAAEREDVDVRWLVRVLADQYWCRWGRTRTWQEMRKDPDVRRLLARLRQLAPESAPVLLVEAIHLGLSPKALPLLDRAIAASAEPMWQAFAVRGKLRADLGQGAAGLRDLDQALTIAPGTAWVLNLRGWVLLAQLKADAAQRDFTEALAGMADDAAVHLGLGLVATLKGEYDAGERHLLRALTRPALIEGTLSALVHNAMAAELGLGALRTHVRKAPERGYLHALQGFFHLALSGRKRGAARSRLRGLARRDLDRGCELLPALAPHLADYRRRLRD